MREHSVSVVIPTTMERMEQLELAIDSVLAQTYPVSEVIIVVDGRYENAKNFVARYDSQYNIKMLHTGGQRGGAFARNYGIQNATSKWIALLDDDDVWLPNKLSTQIKAVLHQATDISNAFSFTKAQIVTKNKTYFLPRIKYVKGDSIADFLFVPTLGKIQGFIQTSTFLATRELFLRYPFDETLKKHQDWDLALNLELKHVEFIYIDEILSIYNHVTANSVGKINTWRASLDWINRYKHVISEDAYQQFLIVVPMRGVLQDKSLDYDEILSEYQEMNRKISMKNKFSIKYIESLFLLNKYKLVSQGRRKGGES